MKISKSFRRVLCAFLLLFSMSARPVLAQDAPREQLLLLLSGEWVSRALYAATRLEIADHLEGSPKSVEELAKATESDPESLYRVLHMLAGFNIFEEVAPRVFANTEASSLLGKSHPDTLHALSLFYGEEIHKALDELLPSIQSNTPAFELTFKQPVFSYFKENPSRAALFQASMKEKSRAVVKSALSSYDFSKAKAVYDIGGGHGQFLSALLEKHSHLQGTLFELPEVISSLRQRSPELETARCAFASGDFFAGVPSGGDLYLLKSVLHDWDDEQSTKILRNCHRAMDASSRLLIIEVVLQPKQESIYANCMDVLMLAITGGKERSLASFQTMLEASGFTLERVYPTATEFSILEVRKK